MKSLGFITRAAIQQELAQIIMRELNDPRLTGLPSITHVKVSPDLSNADVYMTIMGTPGQQNATYTLTVSNASKAGATSGPVDVYEVLPAGLELVTMAGTDWTCNGYACTRTDVLSAGSKYPTITVTVNVDSNAPASVTNTVVVSGGGSSAAIGTDATTVH